MISDFYVSAVYQNSHTTKPLIYKIAGSWGNHEGSMLLFICIIALYGFAFCYFSKNFDNKFVGITGDPGEIFLLSQSWGIISQKIFFENGDYNIDHSSPVILLKDGKYIAKISHRDDIKKSIKLINKYL